MRGLDEPAMEAIGGDECNDDLRKRGCHYRRGHNTRVLIGGLDQCASVTFQTSAGRGAADRRTGAGRAGGRAETASRQLRGGYKRARLVRTIESEIVPRLVLTRGSTGAVGIAHAAEGRRRHRRPGTGEAAAGARCGGCVGVCGDGASAGRDARTGVPGAAGAGGARVRAAMGGGRMRFHAGDGGIVQAAPIAAGAERRISLRGAGARAATSHPAGPVPGRAAYLRDFPGAPISAARRLGGLAGVSGHQGGDTGIGAQRIGLRSSGCRSAANCASIRSRRTIRAIRGDSRNRAVGVLIGGPMLLAKPEMAELVGADATAADGPQAVLRAEHICAAGGRPLIDDARGEM